MKHIFIINPAAGSRDRTADYKKKIRKVCREKGLSYRIEVSKRPGHCEELARQAAETGEEVRIYACGGDGTLNEVAAGAAGHPNAAITAFSGGSGNDFTKLFSDPEAFFHLEKLIDCKESTFDMIRCNDRLSLNICSVGLDARIGTDVGNYKRIPLLSGFRAYVVSSVINVIRGIAEPYTVHIGGETIRGDKTMICACNGRFYGGGFCPVPEADPTDGLMDVLVVEKVSRLKVLSVIGKYKDGKYKDYPHLIRHFQTKDFTISCEKDTPVNIDGELMTAKDIHFAIAEEKLRFFYPKELTFEKEGIPV